MSSSEPEHRNRMDDPAPVPVTAPVHLALGSTIIVCGYRFILTALDVGIDGPARLTFVQPIELTR
jgi:hypothetical protein